MNKQLLLRLANDRAAVASQLLVLKSVFPGADCGKMLVKELGLMGESEQSLRERADALRAFLPAVDIDTLVDVRTRLSFRALACFQRHFSAFDTCAVARLMCQPARTSQQG